MSRFAKLILLFYSTNLLFTLPQYIGNRRTCIILHVKKKQKKNYNSVKTILHCPLMLFSCCEINYLVHGPCDQMIHYCIDENYYHVINRLMGIITKTFNHLYLQKYYATQKIYFCYRPYLQNSLIRISSA